MAHEHLKDSTLLRSISDITADLADLVQKELRLARSELAENIFAKFRASIWIGVAGGLGLISVFLALQALVFEIASFGISMQLACLVVAALVAAASALAYYKGHIDGQRDITPKRSLRQIKQDISTAKEHLT